MKLKPGDKIVVDLGGLPCKGTVYNPDDYDVFGKPVISFWSYHGWKHMEHCVPSDIMKINKVWQLRTISEMEQPYAACDKCNIVHSGKRYQLGRKTYCDACLEKLGIKV